MIPTPIIYLCTFLYLAKGSTVPPTDSNSIKEDLQNEYYAVAKTDYDKIQPSDDTDAQAIVDSNKDPKVMLGILLYREKNRRNAISNTIWEKVRKALGNLGADWWIREDYIPQRSQKILDLVFCLIYGDNVVLTDYLYNFFAKRLENWITVAFVLTKDMTGLIDTYDKIIRISTFKADRKRQRKPFENMLRVWVRNNRELLENSELLPEVVKQNAEALKKDQDEDGFHEKRNQLELILMQKSIKFARAVILAFEKLNGDKPIENILNDSIKDHDLNENLAYAYSSLARYIKNKNGYIAETWAEFSNGYDKYAAWMLCIAVVQPQEWPKINEEFKRKNNGVSLSEFVLKNISDDKILAEAIAVAVNPTFKPTTFKEIPIDNSPLHR